MPGEEGSDTSASLVTSATTDAKASAAPAATSISDYENDRDVLRKVSVNSPGFEDLDLFAEMSPRSCKRRAPPAFSADAAASGDDALLAKRPCAGLAAAAREGGGEGGGALETLRLFIRAEATVTEDTAAAAKHQLQAEFRSSNQHPNRWEPPWDPESARLDGQRLCDTLKAERFLDAVAVARAILDMQPPLPGMASDLGGSRASGGADAAATATNLRNLMTDRRGCKTPDGVAKAAEFVEKTVVLALLVAVLHEYIPLKDVQWWRQQIRAIVASSWVLQAPDNLRQFVEHRTNKYRGTPTVMHVASTLVALLCGARWLTQKAFFRSGRGRSTKVDDLCNKVVQQFAVLPFVRIGKSGAGASRRTTAKTRSGGGGGGGSGGGGGGCEREKETGDKTDSEASVLDKNPLKHRLAMTFGLRKYPKDANKAAKTAAAAAAAVPHYYDDKGDAGIGNGVAFQLSVGITRR